MFVILRSCALRYRGGYPPTRLLALRSMGSDERLALDAAGRTVTSTNLLRAIGVYA